MKATIAQMFIATSLTRIKSGFLSRGKQAKLSGGMRVRIPQELDVVAFWPWNLDVMVF